MVLRGEIMGIFSSKGHIHLQGHKEETKHKEALVYQVNAQEKVYLPLVSPRGTPNTVLVSVGAKVKKGEKVMVRTDFYVPIFAPISGRVVANEKRYNSVIGRPTDHLVIESDGLQLEAENKFLSAANLQSTRADIISAIKEAGIVGLGGAGFPTFIKYETDKPIEYVLINGVECEPYLTTDYQFMRDYVDKVVQGAALLLRAAAANKGVIAIKVHKEPLPELYQAALVNYPQIKLVEVPDLYPMGWEKTLIKQVFKREYENLPAECGVIVNNAQTAAAVYDALVNGNPITDKLITVAGDGVNNPSNVNVPVGIPLANIVATCGGYVGEEVTLICGGPMTGKPIANDSFVLQSAMGGFTILKPLKHAAQFAECLRCGECTLHCPANLQPVEIKRALDRKDYDALEKLNTMKCVECGLCSFVCPSKIEISDAVKRAKTMLRFQQGLKAKK